MTGVLVRREEETGTDTPSGGGQVLTEAEGEDGSLKLRTDSSPQKLEEVRNDAPLAPPEGSQPCPHLEFQHLSSRPVRGYISVALWHFGTAALGL